MEAKGKPDFSSENLVHYKIKFNSFCISAPLRENVCRREKKITRFPGIQEFKFEGQFIGSFINGPSYNGGNELVYLSGKGDRSQQKEKEEKVMHCIQ